MVDIAFTWMSKKQPIMILSTCEVDIATKSCVCHAIWHRNLLKELKIPLQATIDIYIDNKSSLALANNSMFHDKSKHIDTC